MNLDLESCSSQDPYMAHDISMVHDHAIMELLFGEVEVGAFNT